MAWIIFSLDALPCLIHGRDMEKGQFLKPSSIASHCAVRSDMAIFCAMQCARRNHYALGRTNPTLYSLFHI